MWLRDVFGLQFFDGTYHLLPVFVSRCGRRWQDVWFGRYVAERACGASRSALFEVHLVFDSQNPTQGVLD